MRRLVLLVTLAGVACLGLGAAMVLAGSKQNGTPSTDEILICHAGVGTFHEKWVEETPDASGIIGPSGH